LQHLQHTDEEKHPSNLVDLNNIQDLNDIQNDLWNKFSDFINFNCNKEVIFVHNLGSFVGFFLYKALSQMFKPEEVTCLINLYKLA
jgi:hypothetical protein